MSKTFKSLIIMGLLVLFLGCATTSWKSVPNTYKKGNPFFDVSLTTADFWGFNLKVQKKTDKNIEILWDKTLFIDPSGGTNDYFTYGKETLWEEADNLPPKTIIFPNALWERVIFPTANRSWNRGWHWKYMAVGKNGILLTVNVDGKEVKEELILEILHVKRGF